MPVGDPCPAATTGHRAGSPAADAPGAPTRSLTETAKASRALLERSRGLLPRMSDEDREDTIDLNDRLEAALTHEDEAALVATSAELQELLFFVEGR